MSYFIKKFERAFNELEIYKNEKKSEKIDEKLKRKYYFLAMKLKKPLAIEEINEILSFCDYFATHFVLSILEYLETCSYECKSKLIWRLFANYLVFFHL